VQFTSFGADPGHPSRIAKATTFSNTVHLTFAVFNSSGASTRSLRCSLAHFTLPLILSLLLSPHSRQPANRTLGPSLYTRSRSPPILDNRELTASGRLLETTGIAVGGHLVLRKRYRLQLAHRHGDVPRKCVQHGEHHLALFRAPGLTSFANRSTRTMLPMSLLKMSSSRLWRRGLTSRRSRPWYDHFRTPAPRCPHTGGLTTLQKKVLSMMLNGDAQAGLLMHIIRFVMPSKSKPLKKLMYFFLEVCPKHDAQGKLRQEWILVMCAI
jgi:hypothetical protein